MLTESKMHTCAGLAHSISTTIFYSLLHDCYLIELLNFFSSKVTALHCSTLNREEVKIYSEYSTQSIILLENQ